MTQSMMRWMLAALIAAAMVVASVGISSADASPWGTQVGSFTFNEITVPAYSNGPTHDINGPSGTYGYQYQCVEYVNRFYVLALGHTNMKRTGHAIDYYSTASSRGLIAYPNGGTVSPQPGDILCSDGNISLPPAGRFGHVAIVREVTADSVHVIHQNWANGPADNDKPIGMTASNGHYTVNAFNANYPVEGWLRKPGAHILDQSISPTIVAHGGELTFVYNIGNPYPNNIENVRLGAQIRTNDPQGDWIDDPANDEVVTLLPGVHDYSRTFIVPQTASSGFYDARWVILDDATGNWIDSKEMIRIFEIQSGGRSGGPDDFGYTFKDSNTPEGPTYDWIEISGTGTEVLPDSDDSWVEYIGLGFFFNYYGTDYSQLAISNNGLLFSGGTTWQYVNEPITQTPGVHGFIAPFWDDIVTWGSAGAIYYQTIGTAPNRLFVVEWYDNQHYSSSTSGVIFEAILYEGSNNILFQYKDVDFGTVNGAVSGDNPPYDHGGSATVGIEGPAGDDGLQYSFNEQVIDPSLAILFKFPQFSGTNLYLSKQALAGKDRGSTMMYTLHYHNFGDTPAQNVVLEDTLPAEVEFVSASDGGSYDSNTRKVTWNIGSVAPNGHGYETISVRILQSAQIGTVIQNDASIGTSNLEVRYDDNEAYTQTRVTGSSLPPDVGVEPNNGGTGTPSIYWHNPITFSYQNPTATGVDIRIQVSDGGPDITGSMAGGPPDWTYTTTFYPRHGRATITYTVQSSCVGQYSTGYDVRGDSYVGVIDAHDIEEYIRTNYPNSPMLDEAGIGSSFLSAGTTYNIDPAFLVATAELEGRFGTQGWAASHPECHNTMGWGIPSGDTPPDGINCVSSWEAMVERVAGRIANGPYYYNANQYTVDQIRSTYAGEPNSQSIADMMNALYCFAQQTVTFDIYIDPAGYIYDADTGERIEGATVWLQWSDGEGGWVNVPTGEAPPISQPDENPLITGADGQYQWDVLAGSYRVHVEASGYYPADSIVVSIPPPVTDLHVGLIRLPDTTPPSSITNLTPTAGTTWLNWTWTKPPNPDFNHTEICLDGVFQTITSAGHYNATDRTPETSYTISTRTVDTAGNINQTWVNDTATTLKIYNISFLPPITTPDQFNLTNGRTLPIKFTARDNDTGEFIYDDTVNVTITNPTGHLITYFTNGTGTGSVRINSTEEQYIVNFHTKKYDLNVGETYTIHVAFGEVDALRGYAIAHFTLVNHSPGKKPY
ncbi:MAG: CHAP domain protein [Candidatus Argoarchaeum ethanivorans]|uniref:CHAP domain protein n=1 Tax=Candidatus Argoarchaeum ethanivorans TaxID=2608793 RepID=A0A811T7U6_9EURY|nr:MAG: CHAP domain protein [Candidatus Argoarchaeum ethanivorans]